jgi:LysM repeat protein
MERRSIAHIAAAVAVVAACAGLAEGTAWSRSAAPGAAKAAPTAHTYVARAGDGWYQIAHAHGTTLPHLLAANHATAATPVNVGQKIKLPADAKADSKAAHPAQTQTHAATRRAPTATRSTKAAKRSR